MKKFLQLVVVFGLCAMPGFALPQDRAMAPSAANAPVDQSVGQPVGQPMDANANGVIYDNGQGQCPPDAAVSGPECNCECWQKFVHYRPCYYNTYERCEREVPYCVRCCKMCNKYYTVQRCRYVPQYYCEQKCCQVPEYYTVQRCRPECYSVCHKCCKYNPCYYYKKVCPQQSAAPAPSCDTGCCGQ